MEENKDKHIINLSDSDFMSFLYAERDRENNLSKFHGWNNWALIGAIVTTICAGYSILENSQSLNNTKVLFNTNFIISFFLTFHSWFWIFRRERGVDFSKVLMMKEVFPTIKIIFVFICAISSSMLILNFVGINIVFWLWLSVILVTLIAVSISIFYKNKIVPVYYKDMILPWFWSNFCIEALLGGIYGIILWQSFNLAGSDIFNSEFKIAVFISVLLVLLYVFLKLNFGNKVIRRFDEIMDDYLYAGISKEETFHEILKNRMGYGVLDGCYKELQSVEKQTKLCVEEEKELEEMRETLVARKYTITQVKEYAKRIDIILQDQQLALDLSEKLINRMDEIVKTSSLFKNIAETNRIFDTSHKCYEEVKVVSKKAGDVFLLLQEAERNLEAPVEN